MPYYRFSGGWFEAIVGPMFSGKSEELIRRVTRAHIARQQVQVFKPAMDNRYDTVNIASHMGRTITAQAVQGVHDIQRQLDVNTQTIAIDEAQFFPLELIQLVVTLTQEGKRVMIAGLDLDFRGEPFGPIPELLARAESITKLSAICVHCGRAATRTQRLVNGMPAHYDPLF